MMSVASADRSPRGFRWTTICPRLGPPSVLAACPPIVETSPSTFGSRLMMPAILVLREVLRAYDYPPLIMAAYGMREGAILQLARRGSV